jgi:hypothetical protein
MAKPILGKQLWKRTEAVIPGRNKATGRIGRRLIPDGAALLGILLALLLFSPDGVRARTKKGMKCH